MAMQSINIDFKLFDSKLISLLSENDSIPLGLASGKMGFCIYFYCLSRLYDDKQYESVAESILDDMFNNISGYDLLDIPDGLSGIGLVINYLVKEKYVEGDINEILKDIDDVIFRKLSYPQNCMLLPPLTIIHLLFYLNVRYGDLKAGSEQKYLFQELIIETINMLYDKFDPTFFDEPCFYSINYQFPLFISVLSQTHRLGFYNCRINKIAEELSSKVLSTFPVLQANKLSFLFGMSVLANEIKLDGWNEHITLLAKTLYIDSILTDELRDKNIFFENGFTSIYLLAERVKKYFPEQDMTCFKEKIRNRIINSQMWELLKDEDYFSQKAGLLNGYCGASLLLQLINRKYL